jgi:diketogulonate reductase-like aldo/keto reductase
MTSAELLAIELTCTKLVNQFAVYSDLGRYDELAALFTEDGRYARPTEPTNFVEGRADLLASLKARPKDKLTRHLVTNVLIEVTSATTAKGFSYVTQYSGTTDRPAATHGRHARLARQPVAARRRIHRRLRADAGGLEDTPAQRQADLYHLIFTTGGPMVTRKFGSSGRKVAVTGQGTWFLERSRKSDAVKALHRGLDLGLNHIDTAEMYGNGVAEELVGAALQGRRDAAFVVSKVLPSNASRSGTKAACEASLRRLGTDRLDCYLLHWRGSFPLADTFAAFDDLVRAGKILSFGVSNFDTGDLDEALALLGPGKLACNQVLYHLEERAIEHAVLPWCVQNDVAVVAYSPFGHDAFPSTRSPGGQVLAAIAAAHGATPRQVALAFLSRHPAVFTIPKATTLAHIDDNAGAGRIALTPGDLAQLDAAFPRGKPPRYLPTI